MGRPQPRGRSRLAGLSAMHPVVPESSGEESTPPLRAVPSALDSAEEPTVAAEAQAPEPAQETAPAPSPEASTPVAPSQPAGPPPMSTTAEETPKKQSFYQKPSETSQMRGAYRMVGPQEGFTSLSDFVAKTMAKEVKALQDKYNNGEPFPELGVHQIPKGRPLQF